jgi:quercetin dioxygenase-like cupin family protein
MSRYTYPHVIENGAGEQITFVRREVSAGRERLVVENVVKPGAGPPMHVHHYQQEVLTVQQGRIGYERLGAPPQFAGVGDTVAFDPGDGHRFWNAGEDELRCTGHISPPDNIEFFLGAIFESTGRSGRGRPDLFDVAFLITRYQTEFGMLAIPSAVQRSLFPLLVLVGHLLGRYKKYSDAPEPVRR